MTFTTPPEAFMSTKSFGRDLVPPTTTTELERRQLNDAGQAANRAAANYLFADYRQRRAESTLRTQRAALVLWLQYLTEARAGAELLAEAEMWALARLDHEALKELAEYAESRQTSPPIIYGATYCQSLPAAWHGVTWGLVEGFVKWLLTRRV
jgi:hypothetical protein